MQERGKSRGGRIRTDDVLVPNQARYQTALHPEASGQGIEPRSADLESAVLPLNYPPMHTKQLQSPERDSNPRPADYKSAALPTELPRPNFLNESGSGCHKALGTRPTARERRCRVTGSVDVARDLHGRTVTSR